ncbi:MAG: nucleotidyltransferase family protein [Chlorobium sp.]|nr:nucleotidyltransferase family protein [Chlorobium sp.]
MTKIDMNSELFVLRETTLRDSLKIINKTGEGILFVVDTHRLLLGTLTDGDIRRGLLAGTQINDSIADIYNKKPFVFYEDEYSEETAKKIIREMRYEAVPILSSDGRVIAYEKWNQLLGKEERKGPLKAIDVPVIIMAGGKGTRMAPFTNVLPKPLIPVGEKTILELIIDSFKVHAVREYYFTVNYRAEMIQAYFNCIEKDYSVTYLREKEYLGTAGSLKLLPFKVAGTFIVSNCDIIVKADFAEVMEFHKSSGAMLTVISSIQHYKIPYGVVHFESGGIVSSLEEKPEYSFCINTGVYVLEHECLDYIPEGKMFHMTTLMEALMADGKKVATYPINESEYIDVGQWEEYRNAVHILGGN